MMPTIFKERFVTAIFITVAAVIGTMNSVVHPTRIQPLSNSAPQEERFWQPEVVQIGFKYYSSYQ